jgi:hypothetical protein
MPVKRQTELAKDPAKNGQECVTYIAIAVAVAALAATIGAYYSSAYVTQPPTTTQTPTDTDDVQEDRPTTSGLGEEIDAAIAAHENYAPTVRDLIGAACYSVFRFAVPGMPVQASWDDRNLRCVETAVNDILGTNPKWKVDSEVDEWSTFDRTANSGSYHTSQRWVVFELVKSDPMRVHVARYIARGADGTYTIFTAIEFHGLYGPSDGTGANDLVIVKGGSALPYSDTYGSVDSLVSIRLGDPDSNTAMVGDVLRMFVGDKLLGIGDIRSYADMSMHLLSPDKAIKIRSLRLSAAGPSSELRSIWNDADINNTLRSLRGDRVVIATRFAEWDRKDADTEKSLGDKGFRLTMVILNTVDEDDYVVTECVEIEIQTGEYQHGHVTIRMFTADQFSSKAADRVATSEYRLDETTRRVNADNALLPVYPPPGIFVDRFSDGLGVPWAQATGEVPITSGIILSFKAGVATAGVRVIGGGFLGAVISLVHSIRSTPELSLTVWPHGAVRSDALEGDQVQLALKKGLPVRMPLITGLLCTWSAASAPLSVPTVVGTHMYDVYGPGPLNTPIRTTGTIHVTGNIMLQDEAHATRSMVRDESEQKTMFTIFTTEEHKQRGLTSNAGAQAERLYMSVVAPPHPETRVQTTYYNSEELKHRSDMTDMGTIGFKIEWIACTSAITVAYKPNLIGMHVCKLALVGGLESTEIASCTFTVQVRQLRRLG